MSLIHTAEMLQDAKARKYAVPAYDVMNYETMRWVVDAAEEMRSPVILMIYPAYRKMISISNFAAMARDIAIQATVPVAIHLDHSEDLNEIQEAINCGFTSVMIDGSHHPFAENVALTRQVVAMARQTGVSVEAELGLVGWGTNLADYTDDRKYTNPQQAAEFIELTGADSLAVAIGNSHGVYIETPRLDIPRLRLLTEAVPVPLVLHGTSQIPDDQLIAAVRSGITKTNIATEFYILLYESIKKNLATETYQGSYPFYFHDTLRPVAMDYFINKFKLLNPDGVKA